SHGEFLAEQASQAARTTPPFDVYTGDDPEQAAEYAPPPPERVTAADKTKSLWQVRQELTALMKSPEWRNGWHLDHPLAMQRYQELVDAQLVLEAQQQPPRQSRYTTGPRPTTVTPPMSMDVEYRVNLTRSTCRICLS